jgi:hypothetical protein
VRQTPSLPLFGGGDVKQPTRQDQVARMEAQHEKQRHAAQTGKEHCLPPKRPGCLPGLPSWTYQRLLRRQGLWDPPATPGKAPSIALVLAPSPGSHQAPRCMSLHGWQRALRSRTRSPPLGVRDMQMARGPLCRRGLSNVEKQGWS